MENKKMYFTSYDPKNDIYIIEANQYYIKDSFNNYVLHGGIYTKNMAFNNLKEAINSIKKSSKIIKYININI